MKRSTAGVIAIGIAAIALLVAFQLMADPSPRSTETSSSALPSAAQPSTAVQAAPTGSAGVLRFVIVPEDSTVTYRVAETFFREGNRLNTAVGVTKVVRGEIRVTRADPRQSTIGPITVDISQFRSDSQRRDNAIRDRWLESARFPTAQFTATAIRGLPATYRDDQELRLRVSGNLKVRDVVRPVIFDATMKVTGNTLRGTAKTAVRMTDFGFDPPSILGILRAENDVAIEFAIIARAE